MEREVIGNRAVIVCGGGLREKWKQKYQMNSTNESFHVACTSRILVKMHQTFKWYVLRLTVNYICSKLLWKSSVTGDVTLLSNRYCTHTHTHRFVVRHPLRICRSSVYSTPQSNPSYLIAAWSAMGTGNVGVATRAAGSERQTGAVGEVW